MFVRFRSRFFVLDALRGLAALSVMLLHYGEFTGIPLFGGAWVAVDLFFVLSGFVISHSYGSKIPLGMGFREFIRIRLIRLGPLYFVGSTLGIVGGVLLVQAPGAFVDARSLIVAAFSAILLIPDLLNQVQWPTGKKIASTEIFPLNTAAWSLFFEIFVNIIYFYVVLCLKKISSFHIAVGSVLIYIALSLIFRQTNPGWSSENLVFAIPRVLSEFFIGVCIYESRELLVRFSSYSVPVAVALLLVLLVGDEKVTKISSVTLVPVLVISLANVRVSENLKGLCRTLGDISYPLYICHIPIFRIIYYGFDFYGLGAWLQLVICGVTSVAMAYILLRVDVVLRNILIKLWPV